MGMRKDEKRVFEAQFRGNLHHPVTLRRIGWRVYGEQADGKAYLGGLCPTREGLEPTALEMMNQRVELVSIVPAYDWRAFLYDTCKRDTSSE